MNDFEFDDPAVVAASQQLIHEWSDPVAVAHPDWFGETPAPLLRTALSSSAGRRLLGRRLRQQVPLPPNWRATNCAALPWALGDRQQLFAVAERAGWALLRPQAARVVSRRGIASVAACVGREQYEAAFVPSAPLWRGAEPADLPELAAAASGSSEQLGALLRSVGWCVINQALCGEWLALRSRMHLVAGPQCAGELAASEWGIDAARLIEALQGAEREAWH
jgi:hypothetical protein